MTMDFGGMDFSRVEGDYIDLNNPSMQSRNTIIEIVVVDLTRPGRTVYQLNRDAAFTDEELIRVKKNTLSFDHDAFIPIGEAETINKEAKQIILADQNTITYHHLITVTGKQPTLLSYEFIAGLYTLVDALRVNRSLADKLLPPKVTKHKLDMNITIIDEHNEKIENLGNHKLPNNKPEQATVLISEAHKKLFQVYI